MIEPNNWGRWGSDDERGTLNLLTPEVVLAALGSVRQGRVVSLALPIRGSTSSPARLGVPHLPGRPLPQHFMSVDGGDYAAGTRPIGPGLCVCDDALVVSPHGTTTHLDALCHMWTGDKLYNGHAASRVRSYGATRCGIDKAGGIVTRGVFLDVAARTGVPHLDGGARIGPDELAACGVDVRPGDAVVIRTGWPLVHESDPSSYAHPQPGLSYEAGLWLAERDVALVAMDNAAIAALDDHGRCTEPLEEDLHLLFLWRHGIHLLEMLWLEELHTLGATDFLFTLAPLTIEGGTASPVNPLAVL
ncbi:cyclase family protein [Dactylosporangium sp. AC04546]|uniref:cyclase family protein n=1 Tax=Dactylosporangium sp. AC04546 TaxID=2862460 RepID=UPI001EE0FF33|nr:cyclase family protein [Dactylosporangium sp. AC04546]WVK88239.1 cyclase family protein [Dactylosporangium sp. AC04546]